MLYRCEFISGELAGWELFTTDKGNLIALDPAGKPYIMGKMPERLAIMLMTQLAEGRAA